MSSPTNRLLFSEQKDRDLRVRSLVLLILFAVVVSHLLAMTVAVAFSEMSETSSATVFDWLRACSTAGDNLVTRSSVRCTVPNR